MWQAEHYVGAVRDHALSLACLREGLPAAQARGYDDLSAETLARFEGTHVGALEPRALRAALGACVLALMHEGAEARVPHASVVAERLADILVDQTECLHRTDRFAATRPSMWEHGAPSLLALDPGSRSLAETTKRKPRSLALVVLAAGKGKRMRSATPKVLHPIAGRAALWHVVQAGMAAKPTKIVVVVGHDAPQVEAEVRSWGLSPKPVFVVQRPQRGTAHAVEVAKSAVGRATDVLVANGDFDPVSQDDVRALLRSHRRTGAAATLLTTELDDPGTYGRVIRDSRGRFVEIDEDRETPGADAIREVGTNWIAFSRGSLFATLPLVDAKTKQRERYLNRVYPLMRERGERVDAVLADTGGVMGVNSRTGLAGLEALMRDRINAAHMANGVTIVDPATTYIDVDVSIGPDTVVRPMTFLEGATSIGADCEIGPSARLIDTEVGDRCRVSFAVANLAVLGEDVDAGPFAYLRPGAELGRWCPCGQLRRDQGFHGGSRLEGAAPVVRGRRHDRRRTPTSAPATVVRELRRLRQTSDQGR